MKTAVIYARYSSDSQTEQSIESQLRVCREYAQRNNIFIVHEYIDRAMTGTNDNRPDFRKMIQDSYKKEWDHVLVYKLDRFSRNKYESVIHKKTLKDNGVSILSAMENIPDTPEGGLMESMLEGFNQYYSEELAQKVRRGMRETRIKGLFQGGKLLYGYRLDGRKIVIDENKVETVKYIFSRYANGLYVRQIVEDLTSKGIYKDNKPFPFNRVYDMLKNECYIGKYTKNNEVYENMYPRIIDDETFNKCLSRRRINKDGKQSIRTVYSLRNKLICGYCGKPISAECGTTRHGKKINYYKCSGIKKYQNGCIKETVRQDILEDFVLNAIVDELSKPKFKDLIIKKLLDIQEKPNANTQLEILLKTKKQAETLLNNIMKAVEQGVVNKTTQSRMKALETQIDDVDRQIVIEKTKTDFKVTKEEIEKYFDDALKFNKYMLLQTIIKQISMYNDKMEITFNSPLDYKGKPNNPEDKNSPQGFILSKQTKMKKIIQNQLQPKMINIQVDYYI